MSKFGSYSAIDAIADADIMLWKDDSTGTTVYATAQQVADYVTVDAGAVIGPASATDNAVARFNGATGKLVQDSVVIISDTGVVTGVTDFTASGTVTLGGSTLSAFALTILDDADASTARGTLGLVIGTDFCRIDFERSR
jgi:hypothetical protein